MPTGRLATPKPITCVECGASAVQTGVRPKTRCDPCQRQEDSRRHQRNYQANLEERRSKNRIYSKARPKGARRAEALQRRYGLTPEQWEQMLIEQSGRCAICAEPMPDPHVDHNHTTGAVRKLLCFVCNSRLGWYETFREAVDAYLC